ncbi:MAG: hypothetical protein H6625_12715 [Bdellovibrionaceae bacterium]|nr:hypothetical protein [Pseudobdellovibrionaceae bacterium]
MLCIFIILNLGCKSEHPNPEQLDPIYIDLISEKKETEKLIKDTNSTLENLKAERIKIKPRSVEKKVNERETKKATLELAKLKQNLAYLEIRSERRRVESRRDYKINFKNNKTWPNPEEYKNYLVAKRLRSAPRNWNYRVPKLHAGNPNYKENPKNKK